jgi:uncharacterized protein with HEPN domain
VSRSWILFLRDIAEAAEKVVRYTEGMDLASFVKNLLDEYRRATTTVDKILKVPNLPTSPSSSQRSSSW